MNVIPPAGITLGMLRDGEPVALAALCGRRGPAVLAYCEQAAGPDSAVEAAADAFARFRRAILVPGAPRNAQQAEALLRCTTRRAALSHVPDRAAGSATTPATAGCDGRAPEVLGYLEQTLDPAGRDVVAAHMEGCPSCAAALRRLQSAEAAFTAKPATALPRAVAREILTALALAAPVNAGESDAVAVGDEALRLLTGGDEIAATASPSQPTPVADPAPVATAPPSVEHEVLRPASPPPIAPPATPDRPAPAHYQAPPTTPPRPPSARLRARVPWFARGPYSPRRSATLLRGAARLLAVVVVAGAAGTGLGLGIAALTSDDGSPPATPAGPASSTPRVTTSAGPPPAADKLPIDVLSATAGPPRSGAPGARLTVHVRVENAVGRTIRPAAPELLVGGVHIAVAAAGSDRALLAPTLAAGAVAEGTLRFDVPSVTPRELTTARARLGIAGKVVVLHAKLSPSAG